MFSAVALVAFSFAGMANNEVKEEVVLLKACWECDLGAYVDKYSPCFAAAGGVRHTLQQYGIDEYIIQEAEADAFNSCVNDIDG